MPELWFFSLSSETYLSELNYRESGWTKPLDFQNEIKSTSKTSFPNYIPQTQTGIKIDK